MSAGSFENGTMALAARVLAIPRASKRAIALVIDMLLCAASTYVAFYLRLGDWVTPTGDQWLAYLLAIIFALPLFVVFGLYRAIFRYAGNAAFAAILRACAAYAVAFALVFTFFGIGGVPRTVGLIQPGLLMLGVAGSRALARWWLGGAYRVFWRRLDRPQVAIFGAGSAGRQLAAAIASGGEMELICFLDDDASLWGSTIYGKPIRGTGDFARLVERYGVTEVLLAIPSATRTRRNEILELLRAHNVVVRTLPGVMEIARGNVAISDLRELDIDDLLGRNTVAPDATLLTRIVTDRVVLVTGAGGSIGSELCRQIVATQPALLLLVDQSEFALYDIHQEIERWLAVSAAATIRVVPLLGSITDRVRMADIVSTWRPQTVFHAAAYKHVPLVEHNPVEGVRNNVFGTQVMVDVAHEHAVENFILISSDKAVRPTNVMGATKRLAEMVLQAAAHPGATTRFSMVRFGNVLGSSGSVVPLFRRQIMAGGPVTITHRHATRYFMTIREAAQLVIQAGALADGGEVFLLEMGDPVRIMDLARTMIEMSGLTVRDADGDGDVEICVIGLRPGEKLHEELLLGQSPTNTSHPLIMMAKEEFMPWPELQPRLEELGRAVAAGSVDRTITLLCQLVPDFAYAGEIVDWNHVQAQSISAAVEPLHERRI